MPALEPEKFEDPYKYTPSSDKLDDSSIAVSPVESTIEPGKPEFKFLLGRDHKKDMEGGDAGGLMKTNEFFPFVDFIRSPFSGRQVNSIQHSDVPSVGSTKIMKTSVLTTGFLVAYTNSFEVKVFNIQKPSKETCTQDYS